MPAIGPDGRPLTEPAGSWSRADDPPFSPRMDAIGGTLSDGRVVVWGGHADDGDTAEDNDDVNERVVAVTSTACRACSQQRPGSQSDDRPLPPGAGLPSAPGE
jgi:hypothetical protein